MSGKADDGDRGRGRWGGNDGGVDGVGGCSSGGDGRFDGSDCRSEEGGGFGDDMSFSARRRKEFNI